MASSTYRSTRFPRSAPLALCLAAVFGSTAGQTLSEPPGAVHAPAPPGTAFGTAGGFITVPVTSCADDGSAGTLRAAMELASADTLVDMSTLTCGTITLQTGEIQTPFHAMSLLGPGADRLTIDGNNAGRVFNASLITIEGITVTHGRVSDDVARGGCIGAAIGVVLRSSRVLSCAAYGTQSASGGGISAGYYVELYSSTVADNTIVATAGYAQGGGISAPYEGVVAEWSTISGNTATGMPARGGGVFAMGFSRASNSTIDGNIADIGGGWFCQRTFFNNGDCRFFDSTVSGNSARVSGGGLVADQASIDFESSTVAFNSAQSGHVGGVLMTGTAQVDITLESSIFANNTAGANDLAADIDIDSVEFPTVVGGDDLITSIGHIQPFPAISSDPMLGPLAFNGGPTRTHALQPGSPAIDAGNNAAMLDVDQRGSARVAGAAADIGAFEVQPEQIFANGFD